jgi:GT2 family glycosyltransferase
MNISLLIGLKNNLDYTKNFYNTTRQLYPNVELCFVSYGSTDGTNEWLDFLNDENVKYFHSTETKTFSDTFNKAASLATKDYIMFLHNDIVIAPNFLENIEKHLSPNSIVSYTTIEPPIFAGHERPGKLVKDFGIDIQSFDLNSMYEFANLIQEEYKDKTMPGISFFMNMPRKTYLEIGGLDNLYNPMFCEDIDLCLRFKLLGLDMIIALDAITYHFVSKTSRFSEEYMNKTAQIEKNSNKNFIRKWGASVDSLENLNPKVYDIGFVITNANTNIIQILEPWCSTLYVDYDPAEYIQSEQKNTKLDLNNRIKTTKIYSNDIIVEFDLNQLTNESLNILQLIRDIIQNTNEVGTFELDIFKITINSLKTKNLIYNNGTQRTN